ncbi:hypothetical protein KKI24_07225 [bacterium]|nr:hypothetical protein [bacterium]
MAKRFTDTEKYKKPFIRGLLGPYKLLWDYLYHDCDHAGIWIVDFEIAQIYLGKDMQVNAEDALKYFNKTEQKVIVLDDGKKWFIPSFISFQYGELNPENRAHNSVLNILKKYDLFDSEKNVFKGLIRPLQGRKDKDTDKDMDKVKEKGKTGPPDFETWEPSDNLKKWGSSNGISEKELYRAAECCIDWAKSNGKLKKDWEATIRNWAREDKERKPDLKIHSSDSYRLPNGQLNGSLIARGSA